MPKLIEDNILLNTNFDKNKFELAENFNSQHCVTPTTKLVVVGTITPPAGNGYFYTSPANKIYGYIDEALSQTNLKDLKKELHKSFKQSIVVQIKNELMSKNIAFLDIMKHAIRKKDSPYDNDITYYSLDKEGFGQVPKNACFICNSRLAEKGYLQICEILDVTPNYIYLSQRGTPKKEWLKYLKKILS